MPPLRERRDDIPALIARFLQKSARKLGRTFEGVAPGFLEQAMTYSWPGNVRELENMIERAAILSGGTRLEALEPLQALTIRERPEVSEAMSEQTTVVKALLDVEREHIEHALEKSRWVIEGHHGAARVLGIKPSTLRGRMRKLGIRKWR